jgi:large conductance mechanosensitive channel
MTQIKEFIHFIREQGVIGLAIGFILGGSVTGVVNSLVNDIINPLIGLLVPQVGDLAKVGTTFGSTMIKWGSFISVLLNFVIVAAVVFFVFKGLGLDKMDKKKEA